MESGLPSVECGGCHRLTPSRHQAPRQPRKAWGSGREVIARGQTAHGDLGLRPPREQRLARGALERDQLIHLSSRVAGRPGLASAGDRHGPGHTLSLLHPRMRREQQHCRSLGQRLRLLAKLVAPEVSRRLRPQQNLLRLCRLQQGIVRVTTGCHGASMTGASSSRSIASRAKPCAGT